MSSITPFVQSVVTTNLAALLFWFSQEMYRRLWSRAQSHFLVRLRNHLDTGPLEAACADYHHSSGPGAPVTHPVSRLVRALLVKYLLNLSLRELEQAIHWNLLVKGFVGYALFEYGPDHSTLERFEQWVQANQPRTFFDEILRQIDRDFPGERKKAQMGDTYAMRANATPESLIGLIRHACRLLLATVAEADAAGYAVVISQVDEVKLFGSSDEVKEYRLEQVERSQRLYDTVAAALVCREAVQSWSASARGLTAEAGQSVQKWQDVLDKILADEVAVTRDEQQEVTAIQELPRKKKGTYRIASAADPDATWRVHDEQRDFGYNVSVATTDTFVREIQVNTGSQPDPVAIPALLTAQQEHHDLIPEKFMYDMAAGTGKWHAEVARVSNGQTQLVAPLVPYDERSQRFGPDDFVLSSDGQSLTCPNREVSEKAYRSQSGQGRTFRFTAEQCDDCPLAQKCRGDKLPADHMRQVFISDHRSVLALARTYAQTADFLADMKLRTLIERIIANLVRYHNARDAQGRGQARCDYQAKMNGMAFNIRQWLRELERRPSAAKVLAA